MALNIQDLDGTHAQHDNFVRTYLKTNFDLTGLDNPVIHGLNDMLENPRNHNLEKRNIVEFVKSRNVYTSTETFSDKNKKGLALLLLLKSFPESWHLLCETSFDLLRGLLATIDSTNSDIFPPKWSAEIFRLENCLSPSGIRGILFGIDPISKSNNAKNYATGHAFCFNVPNVPDGPYKDIFTSSAGLQSVYGLTRDINLKNAQSLEYRFTLPYHIAFINFMRTIVAGDNAGSANRFRNVWIKYNLEWLTFLNEVNNNVPVPVLIFQAGESYVFDNYESTDEFISVRNMLKSAPRCAHPSYIKGKTDHCLDSPNAFAKYDKKAFCNDSVLKFRTFMRQIKAEDLVQCPCAACQAKLANAAADDMFAMFLNIGIN